MTTIYTKEKTKKLLEAAISEYKGDTGQGRWTVDELSGSGRPAIGLTYRIESKDFSGDADAPWKLWGGDKILSAAGLVYFDGIADSYVDKWGDDMYCDSSLIEVLEEE